MTTSIESGSTQPGRLFARPIDHPVLAAFLLALLLAAILWLLPQARVDFSMEQLYPQDSPRAQFYKEHKQTFGRDDNAFFIVRSGDPFDPAIQAVEIGVGALNGVASTDSPFSVEKLTEIDGVLSLRPLTAADTDPLVRGTIMAEDGSAGGIVVRVLDSDNHHAGRERIISAVEALIAKTSGEWHMAGMPVIRTAYVRLVLQDLGVLIPLALLVSMTFFIASFRDLRQVALGMVSIGFGLSAAGAAYVAIGGVVDTFSPALFLVVVVVGTSDLIHLVHRFSDHVQELGARGDRSMLIEAARRAAQEIGMACLLTTTTTAVGFLALTSTDMPTIQMFGLGTGIGVVLTYVVTFLLVPPVLARMPPPAESATRHAARGAERMERLGRWVLARRKAVGVGFVLLCIVFLGLGSQVKQGYRVLADLGTTDAARAQDFMESHMGAVLPLQVDVRFEGDAREPEALAAVDGLTRWMRDQPEVGHAVGLPDLAREAWGVLSGEPGALPDSRAGAAQALFALGLGGDDPVPGFLAEDGHRTRILSRVLDVGGDATVALAAGIQKKAKELLEPVGGRAEVTGVAYLIQSINQTMTRQFAGSFLLALLVIAICWMITTRSIRRVLMALVPNLVPMLAVLAALGALGIPLKPTTAMVFSIGLGIAVDDTIHFLAAYERWRRAHPDAPGEDAVLHAYRTAGRSMVDTSVVLVAGHLAVLASEFQGFWYLGLLTAWSVVMALFTDLLLMGPLMLWLDDRLIRKQG